MERLNEAFALPPLDPRPADRRRIAQLEGRMTRRRVRRREQQVVAVPEELECPRLKAASALCALCEELGEPERGEAWGWWHRQGNLRIPCRARAVWETANATDCPRNCTDARQAASAPPQVTSASDGS